MKALMGRFFKKTIRTTFSLSSKSQARWKSGNKDHNRSRKKNLVPEMPQPHGAINQRWAWPLRHSGVRLEDLAAAATMHRLAHLIM